MEITIVKNSGVPLYIQVKKEIVKLIKDGSLKVGSKMPTERELSEQLKISRNTVSTTYNELEHEGILSSYQGKGTFVAEEANTWKAENIKDKIIKFVDLGFEEALETGMGAEEFIEIVVNRVKEKQELMRKAQAIYIECNIEQAKMFSKQLSDSTYMNVKALTIKDLQNMNGTTKKLIEASQIIISTFNHVNEVRDLIKNYNKEVLGVAINADLGTIVKIARYSADVKFGFVCISQEFMFKVKDALEKAGLGNLNIEYTNSVDKHKLGDLINKSDVLIVSPGRYKDIKQLKTDNKEIIEFLYSLDYDSVKALKSKIIELNK